MTTATTERAGAKLYKELLTHYQGMREGAQRDMAMHACEYADKKDEVQRNMYLQAKAKFGVWDEAIRALTRNGGDWLRLDFPKE